MQYFIIFYQIIKKHLIHNYNAPIGHDIRTTPSFRLWKFHANPFNHVHSGHATWCKQFSKKYFQATTESFKALEENHVGCCSSSILFLSMSPTQLQTISTRVHVWVWKRKENFLSAHHSFKGISMGKVISVLSLRSRYLERAFLRRP